MNLLQMLSKVARNAATGALWAWTKPERLMLLGGAMLVWFGVTIVYWPAGIIVLGMVLIYLARETAE